MAQIQPSFRRGAARGDLGVSLVELLIAVALVSLAFMTILSSYTTSRIVQQDLDERAKAMFIAQQKLEETAATEYSDLEAGYEMDIYDDEFAGRLYVMRIIQDMADEGISDYWTRYPDPYPDATYKLVTVMAQWGGGMTGADFETIELNMIRVLRENTIEFREEVSTQAE